MKEQRGQALIEFIMILPILLLIMMIIYDIGNILYQKYNLQNDIDIISDYILNEEIETAREYANKKKITLDIENEDNIYKIKLKYKMQINTPGLDKALGNPYEINEEKLVFKTKISSVPIDEPANLESKDNE